MARVFEAMQKYGRAGEKSDEQLSSFLEFYNFDNDSSQSETPSGEILSPTGAAGLREQFNPAVGFAASADLQVGQALDVFADYSDDKTDWGKPETFWSAPDQLSGMRQTAPTNHEAQQSELPAESSAEAAFTQAEESPLSDLLTAMEVSTEQAPDTNVTMAAVVEEEDPLSEITGAWNEQANPAVAETLVESPSPEPTNEAEETIAAAEMIRSAMMAPEASSSPLVNTLPETVRDEFRRLRSSLLLAAESQQLQVLMVCGVESGDGATFVARNLSLLLAEFDKINVGRFELGGLKDNSNDPLPDSPESYQLALRKTELPNLREISTPQGGVSLSELLRLCDTRTMIERLKERFDFVLIDAPAVTANPDTALLASQVDGVILIAQQDETRCQALAGARAALQNARANVLGVVLNRRKK
jgi:Mrp family chromosome partitioning ATPase